jgi:hypothetical protein
VRGARGLRRKAVVLAAAVLAACSGGGDGQEAAPQSSSSRPPVPVSCRFTEPRNGGEATWVEDGRLLAATPGGASHCLLEDVDKGTAAVAWNGAGDRVLLGPTTAVVGGVTRVTGFGEGDHASWSYPSGTSVLAVTKAGRLEKHELGGDVLDVSFLDRHQEAVYHPAGRQIASAGHGPAGYGIYLASNAGEGVRPLAIGETATRISSMAFSPDGKGLYFVADHGGEYHLHGLNMVTRSLATVATSPTAIDHVEVSPFGDGAVAWSEGRCGRSRVQVRGLPGRPPPSVGPAGAVPIGWLADGAIALVDHSGCDDPGDLVIWRAGEVEALAERITAVDVRGPMTVTAAPVGGVAGEAPA